MKSAGIRITVLAAALAIPAAACAASGHLVVASSTSPVVTNPRVAKAAFNVTADTLRVVSDRGNQKADYTIPPDCTPAALAADAAALQCVSYFTTGVNLLDLKGGQVQSIPIHIAGASSFTTTGLGSRWLLVSVAGPIEGTGHADQHDVLISRKNGRQIDLARDPYGPNKAIDLNRASGATSLCHPLRRHRATEFEDTTRWARAIYAGRALFEPSVSDQTRVTECGRSRPAVKIRVGQRATFNGSYFAHGVDDKVQLKDLGTGRITTVVADPSTAPFNALTPALSATALWIRTLSGEIRRVGLRAGAN